MSVKTKLAVVIPVYGNEESLRPLYERIVNATDKLLSIDLTIQFVNDRSPDNSQSVLEQLAHEDPRVQVLLLSKNHGSFVAITAGLNEVQKCHAVVIMAADLQDPPELIPDMLEAWRAGKQIVLGIRRNRADTKLSRLFSNFFHFLFRKLAMPEMPTGGFDFCLIDHRIVQVIICSSEKNTSLVGLIIWAGFERANIIYDRAERIHGKSMWSFRKKVRYAIDSIISFSSFPLKVIGLLGLSLGMLCILGAIYVVLLYFLYNISVPGWASLIFSIMLLGSFQLISLGIFGEYFWNILEQIRKRPLFIVDRRIGRGSTKLEAEKDPNLNDQRIQFYDTRIVSQPVQDALIEDCRRVFLNNRLILGGEVERFEREFAATFGADHAIGVASGTDAITLSLWACGISNGDRVIMPAVSAPATAVAVLRAGAVPVFVDVVPQTLTISSDVVASAIHEVGARAILLVHLYGNPCQLNKLQTLAIEHDLILIEECAQASGSYVQGKFCGTWGKTGSFSFYPTQDLGAYGDGGAILTNDDEIAEILKTMRFYGQNSAGECERIGINSRLDELQASLMLERLRGLTFQNEQCRAIASRYDTELGFLNPVPSLPGRAAHLYVVRPTDRMAFQAYLKERGIATGVHYGLALHRHRYLAKHGIAQACPVAEAACNQVVSLPCFPGLSETAVDHVIAACKSWLD